MIEINSLDHSGRGISKLNNKIVFIKNALPNEIVDINIIKEKKNYIEASVNKYIKTSEKRIDSSCPYFNECGGCDLLHLSYEDQLNFKQEKIENILKRYINENIYINSIVKSDKSFNYRNKATFQVKEKIGFYKDKTHELINIDNCLLCNELINNSIEYLNKLELKNIDKIVCRTNNKDLMIIIETYNKNLNITCIKNIATSIYFKIKDEYILACGKKNIVQTIGNYNYLISPDSFFQININVCEKLYNKIKKYVGSNIKVLDLYCGTGSIGIFVSKNNDVLGIEINESAIKDANENKKINNIENISFICGDSGKKMNDLKFNPDTLIIDPPRSGLNQETINNILKLIPKRIVYVSCDPMTLARDLNMLKTDYIIEEVTPFDMFPNTKHVECVSVLCRKTLEK